MPRLDVALAELKLAPSRNKAQELIAKNRVMVNSKVMTRSSIEVNLGKDTVELAGGSMYVGRAGEKLAWFLEKHPLEIKNRRCLDIGSSTGGFAQVLLEQDAREVVCVDVGSDQLHSSLRGDSRILLHEQTDIRDFQASEGFEIITCDVSFISLQHILLAVHNLAEGIILLLFKPQFEVGPGISRTKRGVVKDQQAVDQAKTDFLKTCESLGWTKLYDCISGVEGKEGNREHFYCFQKRDHLPGGGKI